MAHGEGNKESHELKRQIRKGKGIGKGMKGIMEGTISSCNPCFIIIIFESFNCYCIATITLADTT